MDKLLQRHRSAGFWAALVVTAFATGAMSVDFTVALMVVVLLVGLSIGIFSSATDRGILVGGGFLPWPRVESYRWEPPGAGLVALKLRVPVAFASVPAENPEGRPARRKGEAEDVMNRQFAEWPGRIIAK